MRSTFRLVDRSKGCSDCLEDGVSDILPSSVEKLTVGIAAPLVALSRTLQNSLAAAEDISSAHIYATVGED